MTANCLIVDDEPLAASLIEKYVHKLPQQLVVKKKCHSAIDAFNILASEEIDLMFLDIHMPGLTGLEFLKALDKKPAVILTTAYREYALEGFELDVIDYLLKPISFPRFLKAIQKFLKSYNPSTSIQSERLEAEDYLYVTENRKQVKLNFSQILYLESMKDYVRIYMEERKVLTKSTFTAFCSKLPDQFLRIHRSYAVNQEKISAFSSNAVSVSGIEIPIGLSYKKHVLERLNQA